jgi:hypothetical protein
LLAAGENPKVVTHRLGHANVSITLSLYSHVLPGHDSAAADVIAAAYRTTDAACDQVVTKQG